LLIKLLKPIHPSIKIYDKRVLKELVKNHTTAKSPTATQLSVALLTRAHDDHCALSFRVGVALTVVPDAPAMVVCPAPVCKTLIWVPTENATEASVGIVRVLAAALDISINFEASVRTKV
jgi:hypothetical protein